LLQGLSLPIVAKVCAAVCLTGGAGVTTYKVADIGEDSTTIVATNSAIEPAALAFEQEPETGPTKSAPATTSTAVSASLEATENTAKTDTEDKTLASDTEAPELVLLSPTADSEHDEAKIVFEGETEPGATVKAGSYPATVDEDGSWRIELILSPGANAATFAATDEAGNIGYATIKVWLIVEEPEKKQPEKTDHDDKKHEDTKHEDEKHDEDKVAVADVAFSANQKYGTCDAAEPYEVFWGTATPGSKITISSAYGSATTEVGEKGHWEKKLYFQGAPVGESFAVTVAGPNGSASFDYVVKAPAEDKPKTDEHIEHDGDNK
jgi:hypothetical protein